MCLTALDFLTQKFGLQRAAFYTGVTNEQKALNGFDPAVYYPTNWHNSQYATERAKTPAFTRYGGTLAVSPEWFQKNYLGSYPLKQQPIIEQPEAFTVGRYA